MITQDSQVKGEPAALFSSGNKSLNTVCTCAIVKSLRVFPGLPGALNLSVRNSSVLNF